MTSTMVKALFASPNLLESATLIHETAGMRNEYGEWVPGTTTQTTIPVITEPLTGEERLILPEALRETENRVFYVKDAVEVVDDDNTGDVIEHNGRRYRAYNVEVWGAGYNRVLGVFPTSSSS